MAKHGELKRATIEQLENELRRVKRRKQIQSSVRGVLYTLVLAAALAVLVATLWLPVIRIHGNSMTPTLNEGNIVLAVKDRTFQAGDLCGFYYGDRLLVKRIIAGPNDWMNMDGLGNVYVNGEPLDEPYLAEKAYGDVSIAFPYQVPEGRYFVMGDHRSTSADSRSGAIGCVAEEQLVGKIVLRVWPLNALGGL